MENSTHFVFLNENEFSRRIIALSKNIFQPLGRDLKHLSSKIPFIERTSAPEQENPPVITGRFIEPLLHRIAMKTEQRMNDEQVTLEQLRKRLNIYLEESEKLKQTFSATKIPSSPVLNGKTIQQIETLAKINEKDELKMGKHKQTTEDAIKIVRNYRAKRNRIGLMIFSLVAVFLLVVYFLDLIVQLLCISRIINKYTGAEHAIPQIYLQRFLQIQKAFSFIARKFKSFAIGDWELPS